MKVACMFLMKRGVHADEEIDRLHERFLLMDMRFLMTMLDQDQTLLMDGHEIFDGEKKILDKE